MHDQAVNAARLALLEESQCIIREALQGGANLIYYHHGETTDGFRTYKRQMRVIRQNCMSGKRLGVGLGEVTDINAERVLLLEGSELDMRDKVFNPVRRYLS